MELDEDFKDVKNGKGFIFKIIFFIILLAAAIYGYLFFFNKKSDVPSIKDNFFQAVNYDLLKDKTIPNYSNSWSYILKASERVESKKQYILDSILNDQTYKNEEMETFIEMFNNYEERNKIGLSELKPYFDLIDNSKTIEDFNKAYLKIQADLDISPFINYNVEKDVNNNAKNVLSFSQAKMEDIFEVYSLEKYKTFTNYYKEYRLKLLKLYGYSDEKANEVSSKIDEFILKIQSKSKVLNDLANKTLLFNYYTLDNIKKDFHNLPFIDFLKQNNIDKLDTYVFYDYEHYKWLDENYNNDNLQVLKEMYKLSILENVAPLALGEDYLKVAVEQINNVQGTNINLLDFKIYLLNKLKAGFVGDELFKRYEAKYFTDDDKKILKDMIDDIKNYYKKIINESKWLMEDTKKEAIKKLDNMKSIIGYQEQSSSKYNLIPREQGGTLLKNIILMTKVDMKSKFTTLNEKSENIKFDDLAFNAYYYAQDNVIVFPAAFYEIVNNEEDYYSILGYIGTIIGHEISHAFDVSGSKFDENGNARDWWTTKDKEEYFKITNRIIDYYNGYSVQGVFVDGKNTLSENIADLAGVNAVVYVAEQKGATNDDYKKIFEAFAKLWADKISKENLEKTKVTDEHAFNEVRVNAVLSSIDKFYDVYDIKENDDMFVPKENRVGLW